MRIGRSRARGRLCPRLVGVRLVAAEQFVAGERGITCFSLPEKWRTVSQLLLTIFAVMLIGLTGVADHLVWRTQMWLLIWNVLIRYGSKLGWTRRQGWSKTDGTWVCVHHAQRSDPRF